MQEASQTASYKCYRDGLPGRTLWGRGRHFGYGLGLQDLLQRHNGLRDGLATRSGRQVSWLSGRRCLLRSRGGDFLFLSSRGSLGCVGVLLGMGDHLSVRLLQQNVVFQNICNWCSAHVL